MKFCHRFLILKYFPLLILFLFPSPKAQALDFGNNKVRYHTDHHWKIRETEHFQIYYYQECESIARVASQYAEDAFVKTSQVFDYVPKNKIPLFIYGTGLEFQETNITPEILSEGVGGFTEVFKNRIVLPMDGSYYEFEKILHHELTHAFQYDLIYGEGWRSINLFKAVFIPQWIMEGMAEWNAQHLDGQGEMVLRDAILNDQVIPLNMLESFDHFEQVYMAYKESQSILDYITQVYGSDKVPKLFKRMAANQPPDTAVKGVLGVSLKELYDNWHFYMKTQTWSRVNNKPPPERYGEPIETDVMKSAVSPDGTKVALLKRDELILFEIQTKKKRTLLKRYFQTQGSGVAWSPDGKFLAFCAGREGEYGLYTMEVKNQKVKELLVPHMPVIYSPAWSNDQKYIIFSGFNYKNVDLYRYSLDMGQIDRLTNDLNAKSWAQYSADGGFLFYIDEDKGETQIKRLALDQNGLPQNKSETIGQNLTYVTSFSLGKDGIYFTSNRTNRIFNLFKMDFEGANVTQLSNTYVDILSVSPAPDFSKFYVTIYQHTKESLYSFQSEKLEALKAPLPEGDYLSNSFENASKVLAVDPLKNPPIEVGQVVSAEKTDNEEIKPVKPPTQSPLAITRLEVAEASNIVQLQWPVTFDLETQGVDSYKIYRSTVAGGTFSYVGSASLIRQGKYTDYEINLNQSYYYYVTAVNKIGESRPSPIVEANPSLKITEKDYQLEFSPDILLLLAGYDSSVGFVGGGLVQISDYLGDHHFGILGDTVPGVETGIQANYEFAQWRTTVDLDFYYYQNYLNLYDLQTGNVVTEYRNNENGLALNFTYPINQNTRIEYGIGTQRFQGTPLYLQFSEGISNYSLNSDQWNVANYYRLSFVKEERKVTQLWPSSGYALNFTLLQALPVLDYNVTFANLLFETQAYVDFGFLNHLIWANRFVAMTSQGPNPQSFFIGDDAPFQAFFTTIRGYGGDTFFGSNLGLWNTELRYPIATKMNFVLKPLSFFMIDDIELAAFMDTGVVNNQISDFTNTPVLSSAGAGIRFYNFLYQRAPFMLRFDVAWRLDQSTAPTFHFNLAPMF